MERMNKNKSKCACGCRQFAKKGNRFILGHTWKGKHWTLSKKTKKKMSLARKGKYKGKNHPMWGKHRSKETKEKLSKANSGKNNPNWGKKGVWAGKKRPAFSGKNNPNFGKKGYWAGKKRPEWSKKMKGKNHPMWGKHHSKKTRKKQSLALSGKNNPMYGKTHSKKIRKKLSKSSKKKCGGKNNGMWGKHHTKKAKKQQSIKRIKWIKKHPEWREQARQHCIKMLKKGYRPSKFEKRIMDIIKQNSLPYRYIGDFQLIIGGKCPDFINTNGQKILIETYDNYWKKQDYISKRRRHFAKFGFKTKFIHYKDSDEKIIAILT
jgi:hypothetical protein